MKNFTNDSFTESYTECYTESQSFQLASFEKMKRETTTFSNGGPLMASSSINGRRINFSPKKCWRKVTLFLFSHIGTLIMLLSYIVMGGFLFQYLELDNEKNICNQRYQLFISKLNESEKRTVAIVQGGRVGQETIDLVRKELQNFAKEIFTLNVDPNKICSTTVDPTTSPVWSTINSIYFSATVVTTIGYGHIAPNTKWGKIVCIVYSILGIPLMLLFLTNIGQVMSIVFKAVYLNLCCCRCFIKIAKDSHLNETNQHVLQGTTHFDIENAAAEMRNPHFPPAQITNIVEEDFLEDENEDEVIVNIPITVVLLVLSVYIMIGAAIFLQWELDWNFVDGAYFCFITLATIGFGDLVPGKGRFENPSTRAELIAGSCYCLFGLAILSMCFNLIQDEITAKFQWLSDKLGFQNDDRDDDGDIYAEFQSEMGSNRMLEVQENFDRIDKKMY